MPVQCQRLCILFESQTAVAGACQRPARCSVWYGLDTNTATFMDGMQWPVEHQSAIIKPYSLLPTMTVLMLCCLQIEHHLFPAISFMHYPAIAAIVADECKKRGINVSKPLQPENTRSSCRAVMQALVHVGCGVVSCVSLFQLALCSTGWEAFKV